MPGTEARLAASTLDAHPHPTVLVDRERRIVHANAAARQALGARAGRDLASALGCAEAGVGPCGAATRCAGCAVERVVAAALAGRSSRGRAFLLRNGAVGAPADLHVLASAAPLDRGGVPHAVLVLQDFNAILADLDVLHVCGGCGHIAAGDGEWYPLHRILEDRLGLELGEVLCPGCARRSAP